MSDATGQAPFHTGPFPDCAGQSVDRKPRKPAKLRKGAICETRWCRNSKPKTAKGQNSICWKCKSRRQRGTPAYSLNIIRMRARRKGIPFEITIAQFKEFCARTDYLKGRGTSSNSLTVGRIDHSKGYTIDNIQVETMSLNASKGFYVPGHNYAHGHPRPWETPCYA